MEPRSKKSKKWTAFPKQYADQIKTVFKESFKKYLKGQQLIVEGRIYPSEVLLRVGVLEDGSLRQYNFEVSADYGSNENEATERIYDCIDAVASLMQEYFETPEGFELPFQWTEMEFNEKPMFVQHSRVNTELENKADEILGTKAEDLVVADSDDDEDGGPTERHDH